MGTYNNKCTKQIELALGSPYYAWYISIPAPKPLSKRKNIHHLYH